jgi:regulator of replication initiation timing
MFKKELEMEEKVNLLEKEIKLLGEDAERVKLDLEEAVDCLRLEIESLKAVLKELVPDFQEKFSSIRNTVIREIDPQWMPEK